MSLDLALTDSVVLVTGGVRGIGAGIAATFASAGATVVACARHAPERPAAGVHFEECDVRDPAAVNALMDRIAERFGALNTVVNNAGGSPFAEAATASANFHAKIVELNLLAPLIVAQAANRIMQAQAAGGSIVNISSISGVRPSPGTAAYGAAKAGLNNLTSSLAIEWAPKVRVNSIAVGLVETERSALHYGDAAGIARVAHTVPLRRMAVPSDVGNCAVFLASPLAAYVSGSTLLVHGGGETPTFLAAAATAHEVATHAAAVHDTAAHEGH